MQETLGRLIVTVYVIGAFALIAYVAFFAFIHHTGISRDPSDWGSLGDYFGGLLNPVISFATLVVAYAVWKQQREELKETKEALEEQAKTAEQQRREQRFFDVLKLYQETLNSVAFERLLDNGTLSYAGKGAFQYITNIPYRTRAGGNSSNKMPDLLSSDSPISDDDADKLNQALEQWSSLLDHYFRVIFLLLNEAAPTLGDDHFRYVKYLRAQLSKDELQLLTLNMLFDSEGQKMVTLAARYGVLKHLPAGRLRDYAEQKLPPLVFGKKWAAKHADGTTPC